MRRMQTFGGMDWLAWGIKMILSVLIDAVDIVIRLGLVALSWGLSLAIPDPVNFIMNLIQMMLASVIWGKADAVLQLGETVLEFIPVAGKVIDFTPVLTIGGIMNLLGEVDLSQVPIQSRKSREEIVRLGVTILVCGGLGLVLWYFRIASWSVSLVAGLIMWAVTWALFQIDWARVPRPTQRIIGLAGGVVIVLSLTPAGYYAFINPEALRPSSWKEMTSDGLSEYFPGMVERSREWDERAQEVAKAAEEVGSNKIRDTLNEFWSLLLEKPVNRREDPKAVAETKLSAEIQALRMQGLEIYSPLDLERYQGPVTLAVANQVRLKRALGYLVITGALVTIFLLVIFWPTVSLIPLKSDPRALPSPDPEQRLIHEAPPPQIEDHHQ